jgi:hypothetical protein
MIPSSEAGAILRALGRRGDSPVEIACSLFRAIDHGCFDSRSRVKSWLYGANAC